MSKPLIPQSLLVPGAFVAAVALVGGVYFGFMRPSAEAVAQQQAAAAMPPQQMLAAVDPNTPLPPNHPPLNPADPHGSMGMPGMGGAPAAGGVAPVAGEVLEAQDVPGYTYLRLKTASGEEWAAVPTTKVAKGAKVTVVNPMVMQGFASKTLGKTFDRILFGQLQ